MAIFNLSSHIVKFFIVRKRCTLTAALAVTLEYYPSYQISLHRSMAEELLRFVRHRYSVVLDLVKVHEDQQT